MAATCPVTTTAPPRVLNLPPSAQLPPLTILALGGELKSAACVLEASRATFTEPLGDLKQPDVYRRFLWAVEQLRAELGREPDVIAHDLHPLYLSTQAAHAWGASTVGIQHHHAHIASLMAEVGEPGPLIGLACDGTGYGTDGAVWGCELLWCRRGEFRRIGHLEYFPLVGGDLAAVHTWRPAAALLRQALGEHWRDCLRSQPWRNRVDPRALELFDRQVAAGLNAPPSSSLGRVFDAISFLLGLCDRNSQEAEAAIALEAAAGAHSGAPFPYQIRMAGESLRLSIRPTLVAIVEAVRRGEPVARIAARFHETVARLLVDGARSACERTGVRAVGLSGGCFANRRLLARVVELLEAAHLNVRCHRRVSCGDGGLALGQAAAAAWQAEPRAAVAERRMGVAPCA